MLYKGVFASPPQPANLKYGLPPVEGCCFVQRLDVAATVFSG
jgi:hypothetical protein